MNDLPLGTTVAVLHHGPLAAGSPSPRDRQLLRRLLDLAGSGPRVVLVSTEPVLGSAACPELDAAGVQVVEAAGRVDAWLASRAPQIAWLVATDLATAGRARRVAPSLPLVVDLAELPSVAVARTFDEIDPLERPGLTTRLAHQHELESQVCGQAALVICGDGETAAAVRGVAPGALVAVVAPSVPCVSPFLTPGRSGVAVVGRFATEPGLPDEALLADLAAASVAPIHAIGTDAAITRRALRAAVASAPPVDALVRALRSRRVAVVSSGQGPLAAELTGLGMPTVVGSSETALARLRSLLADDDAWQVEHEGQRARAREHHDPARQGARYLAALRDAGLAVDAAGTERGHTPEAASSYRAASRAGTLAAATDMTEASRAEAQPDALLPWQHALYTNLDLAPDVAWRRWLGVHHDVAARRDVLSARAARLSYRPLVSVIMPVHDTDPALLRAAIESVRHQIYDRWELCIADDGTRRADTRTALDELADDGKRVRRVRLDSARGIAAATNAALALARGAYVAFLDHDDVLSADALLLVVRLLERDPSLDVVYTDEDKLDERGARVEPFCKPDWSPDLLLSCNYITHLLVGRRTLIDAVGGLREGYDGAQDYDLLLRLTERTDRVGHVAAPLYSWRKSPGSTAADITAKPAAHDSSRRALTDAVARRGLDAVVEPGVDPTWHRVRYRIVARPAVTVVIPTRDRVDLLEPCIDLVRATVRHEPLEILVVDNETIDAATRRYLDTFDGRVVRYPHRFNYARQMNLAALEARGEVLLLLNNDARPSSDGWFDAMLEHALRPEVGAVGARLRFPDGRAQHEGIVLNAGGVALNLDSGSHAVFGDNVRNVAAVTGACLMTRTSVWHAVGGMDERLRVAYNDVDLCLRIGECGWRVIYTPLAELRHAESSSRGSLHPEIDEAFYQRRWGPPRTAADPFFTTAIELLAPFSPRL